MSKSRRRLAVLTAVGVIGAPLAVVATAFACANLAAVKLSATNASPGGQVSFTGRNFNSNAAASAVSLRWNSRNGAVLLETRAAAGGKIRGTFNVPSSARPGQYIIVATQTGPNGRIASGTPGRAPLKVRAASGSSVVAAPVSPTAGPGTPLPLVAGLGVLALALLGGVSTMALRRRPSGPALAARP